MPKSATAERPSTLTNAANAVKSLNPLSTARVSLTVSEYVYNEYAKQAEARGETPEVVMQNRLSRCANHTANSPLYFNDAQKKELEQATGWMADTPEKVIARLREVSSVEVCGIVIDIPARLRTRLESRVFRGQTFESMVTKEVIQALERHVGIRPY